MKTLDIQKTQSINNISSSIVTNTTSNEIFPAPSELLNNLLVPKFILESVQTYRQQLKTILNKQDKRLMVIIGPCSIHDPICALDYAKRLLKLTSKVNEKLMLVMRTYFEKPRTTIGWKGLASDPDLDGSYDIRRGIKIARELLLEIAGLGVPTATELLDPMIFPFFNDLISYVAIGARTCESQVHRQIASGLDCPVGLKNPTDGSITKAIEALEAVTHPHAFLAHNPSYGLQIKRTAGNEFAHIVLRGGVAANVVTPNYDTASIKSAEDELTSAQQKQLIVVDCSHNNSQKKASNQAKVLHDCLTQIKNGNQSIVGLMLESNIHHGKQTLATNTPLCYGVSITDECIGWEETEELLLELASKLY
ncbi:MAG: 3-deoxy-7-phosphoheptulonate synthase [Deltaproteobacteria bacterium]|jgi:3-deoxy-7-phosphoheptulonate synthase|nr:3-deoxy-7-phosphoheptulonate synthase [Deltaproteobacteria bacterium]